MPSTRPDAGLQAATAPAQNQLSATLHAHADRHPSPAAVRSRRRRLDRPARPGRQRGRRPRRPAERPRPRASVRLGRAVPLGHRRGHEDDAIDPRRLLVNADTPYSFLTGEPGDRGGAAGDRSGVPVLLRQAQLEGARAGLRRPCRSGSGRRRCNAFTESTSTMRWLLPRPPVVAGAAGPPAGAHVARVLMSSATDLAIAVVTFDEPAYTIDISVFWTPAHVADLGSALVVEAVRGLKVVDRQVFPLSRTQPVRPDPLPRRPRAHVGDAALPAPGERCGHDPAVAGGAGDPQPALPHRPRGARPDRRPGPVPVPGRSRPAAASSPGCPTTTTSSPDGAHDGRLPGQRAGGRGGSARRIPHTRPAGPERGRVRPGTELEPYVESVYPGATGLLYRREPVVAGVRRAVQHRCCRSTGRRRPNDPAERTQLLEWVLAVQQADGTRLSVPTADWVVAHRGTAPPPRPWVPRVIDDVLVRRGRAPRADARTRSLSGWRRSSCSRRRAAVTELRLHSSQILTHAPGRPGASDPTAALWPAAHHASRCRSPQGRPARLATPVRGRRRDRADGCRRGPDHLHRLAG